MDKAEPQELVYRRGASNPVMKLGEAFADIVDKSSTTKYTEKSATNAKSFFLCHNDLINIFNTKLKETMHKNRQRNTLENLSPAKREEKERAAKKRDKIKNDKMFWRTYGLEKKLKKQHEEIAALIMHDKEQKLVTQTNHNSN